MPTFFEKKGMVKPRLKKGSLYNLLNNAVLIVFAVCIRKIRYPLSTIRSLCFIFCYILSNRDLGIRCNFPKIVAHSEAFSLLKADIANLWQPRYSYCWCPLETSS